MKGMLPWPSARSCFLSAALICLPCAAPAKAAAPNPAPTARIPVEPLGFVPPPRFFMPYRVPSATLNFLDATHLLFTFHVAALMHREPDDPPDDQDQTVRALVLTLPTGKIEAEGTWRLHDRGRYLWTLRDGFFLLRKRDTLYVGDKTLTLKPYLNPEGTLASVQLSPDAGTLTVQFAKPLKQDVEPAAGAPTLGDDAPRFLDKPKEYSLLVVDTHARSARRAGRIAHLVELPMVEGGYLDVQQGKGKDWAIDVASYSGESRVVTTVSSTCEPRVEPVSARAFLAWSCLPMSPDHLVQAYDLQGRKLWEQVWQSRFTWGRFAYSEAGNRFAYGSVEVNHELATLDPVDESSIVGQPVGVFSIASGKLDTVLDASPILTSGDNFALSPDGDTLAILRDGAIELYALPPVAAPPDEPARAQAHP